MQQKIMMAQDRFLAMLLISGQTFAGSLMMVFRYLQSLRITVAKKTSAQTTQTDNDSSDASVKSTSTQNPELNQSSHDISPPAEKIKTPTSPRPVLFQPETVETQKTISEPKNAGGWWPF